MRLIDANALIAPLREEYKKVKHAFDETSVFQAPNDVALYGALMQEVGAVIGMIEDAKTIDAVPSEMLYDFIREIGAITYGKDRFFHEEIGVHCGLWYDRKTGEWITTQTAIEECLKSVRELDDGDIDAEPVKHGKWIEGKCNRCGEHAPYWSMATTYYRSNYCPNCGCRMDQ